MQDDDNAQGALRPEDLPRGSCPVDHAGCLVCSDAGIAVRVVALQGDDALCLDARGTQVRIAVDLVAPVPVGAVLLTHAGVAIGRIVGAGARGGESTQ